MRLYIILYTFQMSDIHEFSNDSEDERAAEEEEGKTLAASDSWIGLANSTPHRLKVKTYSEYVREVETKGEDCHLAGTTGLTTSLPQYVHHFLFLSLQGKSGRAALAVSSIPVTLEVKV